MTELAPKPNPAAGPPGDEPQGSLGAVLIGGAILLVAALLIFWPSSESASGAGANGSGSKSGGVQGSDIAGGGPGQGVRGITPREVDPVEVKDRAQAAFMAPNQGMTMMPTPKPEPTSFASTAEEIAYVEKKLEQARRDVVARTTFLDRMKKIQDTAPISDRDKNLRRAKVVQDNYDKALDRVEELEKRLAALRGK